jgi:hypothetical protein
VAAQSAIHVFYEKRYLRRNASLSPSIASESAAKTQHPQGARSGLCLLDGDQPLIADPLHGVGDEAADLGVTVGQDSLEPAGAIEIPATYPAFTIRNYRLRDFALTFPPVGDAGSVRPSCPSEIPIARKAGVMIAFSAALDNRRDINLAVFSRTAVRSASRSALDVAPSRAFCSTFLKLASARARTFSLL